MPNPALAPPPRRSRDRLTAAVLAGVTFVAFAGTLEGGFVNYDDPCYVTENPSVTGGLSLGSVRWAFTTFQCSNWHPLTWLSLQADASLSRGPDGQPEPRGFHLTSVLVHSANAVLAFLALRSLTGTFWRSLAAALLFAVHPLRVESVAWVAERKDVLSVFFGLLALWAYAAYARAPSTHRYLTVILTLALSLMCKPTFVTLPFLLLVLDWWPLGRVERPGSWRRLALEKLPMFAAAAVSCALTVRAQAGEAVKSLADYPAAVRGANALTSYAVYLGDTVWPANLAPFYPHPRGLPQAWQLAAAALLLAGITAAAVTLRRRAPYLLTGWLWYLGTLVPVLGLVQVGLHAHADRYTYFPQLGLLVALCWGAADLTPARARPALAALLAAAVLVLLARTQEQLAVWHDSVTLWEHDLRAVGPNQTALLNLGFEWDDRGRWEEAARCFERAIRLDPDFDLPHINLGNVRVVQGRFADAEREYREVCRITPGSPGAHANLGNVYLQQGRLDEAAKELDTALELSPTDDTYFRRGLVEERRKDLVRAAVFYRKALSLRPDHAEARSRLREVEERKGRSGESPD